MKHRVVITLIEAERYFINVISVVDGGAAITGIKVNDALVVEMGF